MDLPEVFSCSDDLEINLISACKSGDAIAAEKYVKAGADLNSRDRSNFYNQYIGFTKPALQVAVHEGHHDVIRVLLENGADVSLRDRFGFNALHFACKLGDVTSAQELLIHGADLKSVRQDGERAIHYAATSGNSELIKLLLDYGADPNESDVYGYSPLSYAISKGHMEVCRVLHHNGAIVKTKHLTMAYKNCHPEIVLFLFLHCTDIDEEIAPRLHLQALYGEYFHDKPVLDCDELDEFGRTLLHVSCKVGNSSAVEYTLLHCNSKLVTMEDSHGLTALHYACEPGPVNFRQDPDAECLKHRDFQKVNLEIIKLLIDSGALVNYLPLHNPWTALCHACYIGDLDCVKLLIEYGTDVNAGLQRFPILTAVASRRYEICKFLLESGVDTNILGSSFDLSWSALHLAVNNDEPKMVELLLDNGADPNIVDGNMHQTPIHLVNGKHGAEIVRILLARGADVNHLKKHDESPLHSACQSIVENVDIVRALMAGGAELDAPGWFDRTPLHYACERGHADIILALVQAGAQVDARESIQNPKLHTLEGRFTYDLDTGTLKHARFTPLASLLKYDIDLRKNTSERVLKACRPLIDAQSPDLLLDLTSEEWVRNFQHLSRRCPQIVNEIFVSLCGSPKPLDTHADLLDHFRDRLQWFADNFELSPKLAENVQVVVDCQQFLQDASASPLQMNRVKSLQSWCRIGIRKAIRIRRLSMQKSVDCLPIPKSLKSFLKIPRNEGLSTS